MTNKKNVEQLYNLNDLYLNIIKNITNNTTGDLINIFILNSNEIKNINIKYNYGEFEGFYKIITDPNVVKSPLLSSVVNIIEAENLLNFINIDIEGFSTIKNRSIITHFIFFEKRINSLNDEVFPVRGSNGQRTTIWDSEKMNNYLKLLQGIHDKFNELKQQQLIIENYLKGEKI